MPSTVNWYPQNANKKVKENSQKVIERLADEILVEALGQIEDGWHIDTYFLRLSGYTSKPSGTSSIAPNGVYVETKGPKEALEKVAAIPRRVSEGAGVGFAASYAAPTEEEWHYLYNAIEIVTRKPENYLAGLQIDNK